MVRRCVLLFGVVWIACVAGRADAQLPPVPKGGETASAPVPKLFVAERTKNLGVVIEGDKVGLSWVLENRGSADLVIDRVKSGCGCTVVQFEEKDSVISPAGSLELKAEFDSQGRRGPNKKAVEVYSNDPVEPTLRLELTAEVQALYNMVPGRVLNVRMLRRGETGNKTIELTPAPGRKALQLLEWKVPPDAPLRITPEPFSERGVTGQRLSVAVTEDAALGPIRTAATFKLDVDGIVREGEIRVTGEVVADLIWQPQVVDATRTRATRGLKLAPVTIRSTDAAPFEVIGAEAGPVLDVTFEPVSGSPPGTHYRFLLTIREDAPTGPFAADLSVRTGSFDQPIIQIPAYGYVAPRVEIDPPMILLRQDGTAAGTRRRVKLQAAPQDWLGIVEIRCSIPAVSATLDAEANELYKHLRYLEVTADGDLPAGKHEGVLTVTTNLPGAETLEIPIRIEVPR